MHKDSRPDVRHASRRPATLAGRLAAALALFVLLATGAAFGAEYFRGRQTLMREAQRELDGRARRVAEGLERGLETREALVHVWTTMGAAQDLAVDDVDKRLSQALTQLVGLLGGGELALGTDARGRIVAASSPEWIGRRLSELGDAGPVLPRSQVQLLGREPGRRFPPGGAPALLTRAAVTGAGRGTLGGIVLVTPVRRLLLDAAPDSIPGLVVRSGSGVLAAVGPRPVGPDLTAMQATPAHDGVRLEARAALPVSAALRPLRETARQLATLALLVLAVTLPAAVLLARSTTGELRRLTAAARAVQAGEGADFDRVAGSAPREVQVLSGALGTMVRRLEASRGELARQESLAAMGTMAAALAHEIRTPLSIVRGSAEILGRHAAPGTREHELISFILGEVRRLGRLADDLLVFARPRPPRLVPLDLADVARHAGASLAPELVETGGALETSLEPAPTRGDADQLLQVVLNLVSNARRASPPGRPVRVRTGLDDGRAVLEVSDEGAGIPPEQREEVWKPFVTTGAKGTGLGLPIVRRIVEAHGGTVTLADGAAGGTVAELRLPALRGDG